MTKTYAQQLAALEADYSVKDFHKFAARKLDAMDPVDAYAIAEHLLELASARLDDVMQDQGLLFDVRAKS